MKRSTHRCPSGFTRSVQNRASCAGRADTEATSRDRDVIESAAVNIVHQARRRRVHRITLLRATLRLASFVAPPVAVRLAETLFRTPPRYVRHEREMHVLATGIRSDLSLDGERVAVWSWGEGPIVYLTHGWGGVGSQLSSFVEPIVGAGLRVVIFDGPAHGDSSGRLSSLVQFSTTLAGLVEHFGPAHAVVAHSMGCAATAVAMHRGLTAGRVAFLAPPASPNVYLEQFARILGLRPAIRQRLRERFHTTFHITWEELDVPQIAKAFTTPLLIVHDEEDREALLQEAQDIQAAWNGSRLVVTRGLGHRRLLRDHDVVAQVAAFVAGGR